MATSEAAAGAAAQSLQNRGVPRTRAGIPRAKVDGLFNVLVDRGPPLVVCRHEQNAAFMAAAVDYSHNSQLFSEVHDDILD